MQRAGNATDCVQADSAGTVSWTFPGEAFSDNATYASASVDGTATEYIKCTNYGFSIPTTATITGIVVTVERKSGSGGNGGNWNFTDSCSGSYTPRPSGGGYPAIY